MTSFSRWGRLAGLAAVAVSVAASGLALAGCCCCCPPIPGLPRGGGTSYAPPTASDTDPSARYSLESHLHSDEAWGDTPEAHAAARAVLAACDRGDAVAASQLGTSERRLVVLVQYDDDDEHGLIDMDYDERGDDLRAMLDAIDGALPSAAGQEVVVAIRGDWAYGAMVTRRPGEPPRIETEEVLDTDQLERMLSMSPPTPSTPSAPAPVAPAPVAPAPAAPAAPAAPVAPAPRAP